ncbi:GH36-type glycosyl hydrolase domain-containing protein [Bacillus horti]|uniref:Cellobiose phosphorylase n=1 Tax=Caldalkalibacillus horti TaxID=77523 RepID=A0ABT9W552_9BACI|nr:cellobiose phosphorylase [Bacillus horti]MDQ0168370.1 cellobiose phosphorylase [Bacillus horti]
MSTLEQKSKAGVFETTESTFNIQAGEFCFTFLNSGDLYEAMHGEVMINQWMSNPIDGALNNLYLRIKQAEGWKVVPLLGVHSPSEVSYTKSQVHWNGKTDDVEYLVTFSLTEQGVWFWDIQLKGQKKEVDLIYAQDLGLGSKGFIRSNEAYSSQYIDHRVFEDQELGYVVCSRQNQRQPGGFPYVQQGSLTKAVGYLTDGFQFFGLSYKETNEPEALKLEHFPNEVYQYEFAFTGLKSETFELNGSTQFVFYGLFKENESEAVTALAYKTDILRARESVQSQQEQIEADSLLGDNLVKGGLEKVSLSTDIATPLIVSEMTKEEIDALYPKKLHEEYDGDTLLSFFTETYEHIVLKAKELVVERPHGHILMTGDNARMNENVLTSTTYMYGIFNSQIAVGNTSFNKMLTNARSALNVMKTSGQRIYVEMDGKYHLLTMPSLYEIGFNYSRWYYKTSEDTLVITSYTVVDSPELHVQLRSTKDKNYRYLVTNQISMGNNEYDQSFELKEEEENGFTITATEGAESCKVYPDLTYRFQLEGAQVKRMNEQRLATHVMPKSASLLVLELEPSTEWSMVIHGHVYGEQVSLKKKDMTNEIERYREFLRSVMNHFHLSQQGEAKEEVEKFNALAWWYSHNMLVHYSAPHGLEQYGGAAWGTRDVCQGPAEYFMATQKYETVKEIIKTLYSHQFEEDGNWPQWFMYDKYAYIKAGESHGDIIVWPLKILGDYLNVTQDYSILKEKVPYTSRQTFQFTEHEVSIGEHARKQLDYIRQHFLHDTHLSAYDDGDWDDTLQPANPQLKQFMVSSWTVSLTYQVIKQFSQALIQLNQAEAEELQQLAGAIEADFNTYMLETGVIPGFIYMEEPGQPELMVHPQDTKTGISYRLLPQTRSIIAELVSPEQADKQYHLIKEHFSCPDGVRLMNRPAKYTGGVSTHFQRAEQAANFGREIGLQYVHAHIRFIEAMAKLGKGDEVWQGLSVIHPIRIQDAVPNAERRQSNAYFSSSDGKFKTRYEAEEQFSLLREGNVPVKGGWRIYSSGPGIYMNQLISNALGIRIFEGSLQIDPVLPQRFNGLVFTFKIWNKPVTFSYHLGQGVADEVKVNGRSMETKVFSNRYRQGGFILSKDVLKSCLVDEENSIEIFISEVTSVA